MRILFEDQTYSPGLLKAWGLEPFMFTGRDGSDAMLPYVGYVHSSKINDSIFILPKVFLFQGTGEIDQKNSRLEVAFGKYSVEDVMEISPDRNILKKDGLDRVLFGLSTWIYRAIDKYSARHPHSDIIFHSAIQGVASHSGDSDATLLDTILALLDFNREHSNLFTYITIVSSTGKDKIHWAKTISKVQPVIQDGEPYYIEFRNKSKAINYDEQLIILYYSVLQYLNRQYFFPVRTNFNYDLIKPSKIESLIESGRGTRLLRSIRRRYFKDELVRLWKLLYAFFDKSESIRSGKTRDEALLARSFNLVFEEMVDSLISNDAAEDKDIFSDLKDNKDGKQIDHIYKDRSMLDDGQIYYIGDSKYYFYGSDISTESIYKQFTYARNIIQLNIDIFNKPKHRRSTKEKTIISEVRYRDPLTEGYNLTPNFFIRGYIHSDDLTDGHADYSSDRLAPYGQKMPMNSHFPGRPFDRDTLVLQAYNINFLFVLASYVNNTDSESIRTRIHDRFRRDLIRVFNEKYDFYKVSPLQNDIPAFITRHFTEYIGRMYHPKEADFIWFAFDHDSVSIDDLKSALDGEATVETAKLV